jgi:hypothetical protein
MSAEKALREAYREWQRLAQAEGEAIRAANWSLLFACQKALQLLRERITSLLPAVHQEWAETKIDPAQRREELYGIIHRLIDITRHNKIMLQGMREAAQVKLKSLDGARKQLRQLRSSYGQTTVNTWQSFS